MTWLDYVVLLGYVLGAFAIGLVFSSKIRSSSDLFNAGQQSPWWVAGLSGFMTMFSASTFVVWGSIAYRWGMVAIVINLTYGVAAILVGFFVASRWRRLGLTTAAEFIELRFGKPALFFYTVTNLGYRMVTVGVSLYSIALMASALMPLAPESMLGKLLADPESGHLSVTSATLLIGAAVILYTMIGGLWAVLMTDVLQFIVLTVSVLFVAPMILMKAGGVSAFASGAPDGFFLPTAGEWTWFILAGWLLTQFFMIGAEWAFVQRYLCVTDQRAAKKAAWLFGLLYLISPALWMLPPMVYRTIVPDADPEQAYILACRSVLPVGMLGLMLAAMFSATASMVDSQLNVFAGVLTNEFYRRFFRPDATEKHLVKIGRYLILVLGVVLIALAFSVRSMGGAEKVIVKVTSLLVGPLLLPTIWGLFSKKINRSAVWVTSGLAFCVGLAIQGVLWFTEPSGAAQLADQDIWIHATQLIHLNPRALEFFVGIGIPVLALSSMELAAQQTSPGWSRVIDQAAKQELAPRRVSSALPGIVVSWSLIGCGSLLLITLPWAGDDLAILAGFSMILVALGSVLLIGIRLHTRKRGLHDTVQVETAANTGNSNTVCDGTESMTPLTHIGGEREESTA